MRTRVVDYLSDDLVFTTKFGHAIPKATNFSVSGAKLGAATIYVHNGLCLINIFISMALHYRGKLEKPIPKEQVLCYLTYVNITRNQV